MMSNSKVQMAAGLVCPIPIEHYPNVLLAHGGGGRLTQDLIAKLFVPTFQNEALDRLHDGAILSMDGIRFAFSTDSFVVKPILFPGGDIGSLAVNGTVNDLAMCGARPVCLSVGLIIEEGFSMETLWKIVRSMEAAARRAGVPLVTGDTKVVDRGKGDQIFINTSGVGAVVPGVEIDPRRVAVGDRVILSGAIAEHGIAIMSVREGLEFETQIESDTAALNGLVLRMLAAAPDIHVLRDPTRGGLASALNEIAGQGRVGISIREDRILVPDQVQGACEILGLDPLYVANEGKLVAIVPPSQADALLEVMKTDILGRDATVIGEVVSEHPGVVVMRTRIGGDRVVDMLSGEQLPRIC